MSQQRLGSKGPVEQPRRTGKKGCDSQKIWGVNMLQSLFGLQLPLTHNPFNKERYIFLKNCVRSSLLCCYISARICV